MTSPAEIETHIGSLGKKIDFYLEKLFAQMNLPLNPAIQRLRDSMRYSTTNGGERFRPVLSLLIGELLKCDENKILPFAAAVELIHTYSLIHDDLPCMDNDDTRRGKPTNHKAFDEATALLAGDALLTESFLLIAQNYKLDALLLGRLVELLAAAAGVRGMVGGQAMDLAAETSKQKMPFVEMLLMHQLKTGCMIRVAVEGAALIAKANSEETKSLRHFGEKLGLAFQVADDVLDHQEKNQQERSFVSLLGFAETKDFLKKVSAEALASLDQFADRPVFLEHLINFNQSRQV